MAASVVLVLMIAVLRTASGEYCPAYTDIFGNYQSGFSCPNHSNGDSYDDDYCCGTSSLPYCCDSCLLSQQTSYCDIVSYWSLSTGAIVGIALGSLAFIAFVITMCICCCCACCKSGSSANRTTVVQGQTVNAVAVAQTTYPGQTANAFAVAQTTYPGQQYPQYPPGSEMTQYPPTGAQYPPAGAQNPTTGAQYPPPGAQYPPQGQQYPPAAPQYAPPGQQPPYPVAQGDMAYPPPYPGQDGQPMKQ
ncbi:protein shisa-4-like [Branchiostoma floridae]|uniref:Protein shisa-4-like n=1 Tax=Branchiostoma floridae TaxID=7739 RepID=A0A9J7LAA1_BRAFL|nr:protein shisa-4-like [Branchiostoma floridae]